MILGFTGTRKGLSEAQRAKVEQAFLALRPAEFHHGCCVGADLEAEEILVGLIQSHGLNTVIHRHPPIDMRLAEIREFEHLGIQTVEYPPALFLQRNHDIVDCAESLLACPGTKAEVLRSGSWATIRYARKTGKGEIILYP